ncbi:unnamed protein product [Closterium sp. NIES-53]
MSPSSWKSSFPLVSSQVPPLSTFADFELPTIILSGVPASSPQQQHEDASHAQDQQPPPSSSAPTPHHQEQQQRQPSPPPSQQRQQPSPPDLPPPLQSPPTHQQDQQQQQHPPDTHSLQPSLTPLVVYRPRGYRPIALLRLPDHRQFIPSTVQPPPTQQHTPPHIQQLPSIIPTNRASSEAHSQPAAPYRIDINYPPDTSTSAPSTSSTSSSAHFTSHATYSTLSSPPRHLCSGRTCFQCRIHATCFAISQLPPEPLNRKEAMAGAFKEQWLAAEKADLESLLDRGTWTLEPLPKGKKLVGVKWVYRVKVKDDGSLDKFKARLVVKGYSQVPGEDYNETFASVAKYTSVRALLGMAVRMDLYIIQLDVSNAFLYGVLEEEIYTSQPDGYHDGTERVCRLHKSLYGLKQAPRVWYHALESALLAQGFTQSEYDPALYILHTKVHQVLWFIVYVDDILMVSGSLSLLTHIKGMLTKEFVMTDMGEPLYYLGMNIIRDRPSRSLFLSQERYIHKVLSRFGFLTCNPASTPLPSTFQPSQTEPFCDWEEFHEALAPLSSSSPSSSNAPPSSLLSPLDINLYQSIIGSLMYASVCTRPDLSHAVGVLSQFLSAPSTQHLNAAKRVMRYLSGSKSFGLFFHGHEHGSVLHGFTDADCAGPLSKRKSTGGYMFVIAGAAISWQSKKQGCVALSSTEA